MAKRRRQTIEEDKEQHHDSIKHLAVVAVVAILSLLLMARTTMNVQETSKDLSAQAIETVKIAGQEQNSDRYWLRIGETKIIDGARFTVITAKESEFCNIQINDEATWLKPGQSDSNSYGKVTVLMIKSDPTSKKPVCVIEYD